MSVRHCSDLLAFLILDRAQSGLTQNNAAGVRDFGGETGQGMARAHEVLDEFIGDAPVGQRVALHAAPTTQKQSKRVVQSDQ